MIGSSLPLCYPQIVVSDLLDPRALCFFSPLTKHIRLVGLLLRSVRVFRQFSGLQLDAVKAALSRPTHQRVTQAVGWLIKDSRIKEVE